MHTKNHYLIKTYILTTFILILCIVIDTAAPCTVNAAVDGATLVVCVHLNTDAVEVIRPSTVSAAVHSDLTLDVISVF